jgi:hypothetical protein
MATKQAYGKSAQVATTLALIIGGVNTFGEVEDVKEITFKQEVIDGRGTGIWSPDDFEMTIKNLNASSAQSMNKSEPFIAKGSINENGKNVPYSLTASLELHEVATGIKAGEETKRTLKGRINTYTEVIGGQTTITYNRDAMWLDFGDGVNVMADIASQTL